MRLPDFLIIGAAKSGTSTLYAWLDGHPGVFMSPIKETNYFAWSPEDRCTTVWGESVKVGFPVQRAEDYAALFATAPGTATLGEASPVYLESAAAPKRIRETVPDVKLVAVLRQPADRAYSGYWMAVRHGDETRDPAEALGPDEYRVRAGFYHQLLTRYFETFGRERIHVALFDDLKSRPRELFGELCRFLSIDDGFEPDVGDKRNVGGTPRARWLYRLATTGPVLAASRLLPDGLRRRLRSEMVRPVPRMPSELRQRLTDLYRDDILRLQDLIGRDLSVWLEPR